MLNSNAGGAGSHHTASSAAAGGSSSSSSAAYNEQQIAAAQHPVALPGDEVAIRPNAAEDLWVLANVQVDLANRQFEVIVLSAMLLTLASVAIEYNSATGVYVVMDADDNSKNYELEEANVIHLASVSCKLSKSDEVLAVYPDTTSFYRAVITQPPRRNVQSQGSASVQFADDADETGSTPHRIVPASHIVKLPLA
eukprot:11220-Heterococcus_DN1.PRE.2